MESELKPCPFCGGAELELRDTSEHWMKYVKCLTCGNYNAPSQNAAEAWNTRQADTTLERVKALKDWVDVSAFKNSVDGLGVVYRHALLAKIDIDFPELLEGQSKETG